MAKKMQNMFRPARIPATQKGNAGYDNARESIDPMVIKRHEPLSINFFIEGGGAVIDTGVKGCVRIPFPCSIRSATLLADQTGSIKIDVWKDNYASFPPDNADSICGGNEPEIVAGVKDEDSTLTGWTKDLSAGDILFFNVDSVATITWCLIELKVLRNG